MGNKSTRGSFSLSRHNSLKGGQDKDLPKASRKGITEVYQLFEFNLPFNQTPISKFMEILETADKKQGGAKNFVTIEALSEMLTTPAWEDLKNEESQLYKFLCSPIFKNERKRHEKEEIDTEYLSIFALLHCAGKRSEKAHVFYTMLQEGGIEQHKMISANDKDFKPLFHKMCAYSSWQLFNALETLQIVEEVYASHEKLLMQQQVEALREEMFLEQVFGINARLEAEVFIKRVSESKNWCFSTVEIRKKLLALAGVGVEAWEVVDENEI